MLPSWCVPSPRLMSPSLWAASPRSVPSSRRFPCTPSRPSRSAGPGPPSRSLVPPDAQPVAGDVHPLLQTAPPCARPLTDGAHPPLRLALVVTLDGAAPRNTAPRLDVSTALDAAASPDARPYGRLFPRGPLLLCSRVVPLCHGTTEPRPSRWTPRRLLTRGWLRVAHAAPYGWFLSRGRLLWYRHGQQRPLGAPSL